MCIHIQTDGNTATTIVPGANYSSDVQSSCEDRVAMVNLVWLEDFYLSIEFGAVSTSQQLQYIAFYVMQNGMMNQWNLTKLIFQYENANNSPYFDNPLCKCSKSMFVDKFTNLTLQMMKIPWKELEKPLRRLVGVAHIVAVAESVINWREQ